MTVVVLGESGQLATHIRELLPGATFLGRRTLDLAQIGVIGNVIAALRPTIIVNAAGYTAVDKAESERDLAWRINTDAVATVARVATALDVPLVHVSTDYVFDGRKSSEYDVTDALNPISVYGTTKAAAELAVRTLCPRAWILRVSWVFSEHGANFVKTVLRLAATRESLRIVGDQRGRPTYAGDLASSIAALLRTHETAQALPYGTYHAVGGPITTWHAFADVIVRRAHDNGLLSQRTPIEAITTAEYPTPARRPANSALKPSDELLRSFGISFDWQVSLDRALAALLAATEPP
jgi:dTDP-4-dehydrorhamnose reductase